MDVSRTTCKYHNQCGAFPLGLPTVSGPSSCDNCKPNDAQPPVYRRCNAPHTLRDPGPRTDSEHPEGSSRASPGVSLPPNLPSPRAEAENHDPQAAASLYPAQPSLPTELNELRPRIVALRAHAYTATHGHTP
ncbi:hypothetical protein L226DRAFT_570311 [Lentinus tigrinus ALCF2SS1-7]|uniref:uncharacterized protein n=1 Tax=Lentinus tigrinus ALCF2SS1-7 TaxID=1328758 RepID=UPI0011661871|nr:hypothetical protein L226DRAFT_570311 [Lentinus tigrinus ALCF2SS1-7]